MASTPSETFSVRPRLDIATQVTIEAPAAVVWRILAEVQAYPQWNPYIRELHGELVPGARLSFRFSLFGRVTLPAKARVLSVIAPRELRWAGHLFADALFRAEHYHLLESTSQRSVRLHHGERFSGVLTLLLWPLLRLWAPGRYRAANLALKQRAERLFTLEQPP